jgi:hypothetical protein
MPVQTLRRNGQRQFKRVSAILYNKLFQGKAFQEVLLLKGLGKILNEHPAIRLVFLFLGGFLLGCHGVSSV